MKRRVPYTKRRKNPAGVYTKRAPVKKIFIKKTAATNKFLDGETKYLDSWASDVVVTAPTDCSGGEIQPEGGCTDCLSAPAQGTGEQQRDGRRIILKSCFVSGCIRPSVVQNAPDVLSSPIIFVALVCDTQANGATVVSEQVYTNPNDTAFVNTYPLRNMDYSSRYKILAHQLVHMGDSWTMTDGANTASMTIGQKEFILSWRGSLPVTFTDTVANVTSVTDNALHIVAFATNTSFTPQLSFNCRVRFVG